MSFKGVTESSFYVYRLAVNDYYEVLSKIERLERLAQEHRDKPELLKAILEEKMNLTKDAEDIKKFVKERNTSLSQLIYLRYFEGYTLEEIATELHLSYNNVKKIHSDYARYCKSKEEVYA